MVLECLLQECHPTTLASLGGEGLATAMNQTSSTPEAYAPSGPPRLSLARLWSEVASSDGKVPSVIFPRRLRPVSQSLGLQYPDRRRSTDGKLGESLALGIGTGTTRTGGYHQLVLLEGTGTLTQAGPSRRALP